MAFEGTRNFVIFRTPLGDAFLAFLDPLESPGGLKMEPKSSKNGLGIENRDFLKTIVLLSNISILEGRGVPELLRGRP